MRKFFCDKCGKELDECEAQNQPIINMVPGYGSQYDMSRVTVDLCHNCLDSFLKSLPNFKPGDTSGFNGRV